ncbi:MAG: exported protein of unknown function [Nitrospira sp.]|nr:MAG: exported protein of unknown function [Nitrospira sp.]
MLLILFLIFLAAPSFAGSCQDVGGTVQCTDDVGRDPMLQSLDKSLGRPGPLSLPSSYPDALKSYPSDMKRLDQGRESNRPSTESNDDSQKTSLQGPNPKGR